MENQREEFPRRGIEPEQKSLQSLWIQAFYPLGHQHRLRRRKKSYQVPRRLEPEQKEDTKILSTRPSADMLRPREKSFNQEIKVETRFTFTQKSIFEIKISFQKFITKIIAFIAN